MPRESKHRDFLSYAIDAWAEADPGAALAWIRDENPRRGEAGAVNTDWITRGFLKAAERNPAAALEVALSLSHPLERTLALAGVLSSRSLSADEVSRLLGECAPAERPRIIQQIAFSPRVATERQAIGRLLADAPGSKNTLQSVQSFAGSWAREDAAEAWRWAASLPDVAMQRRALEAISETTAPEHHAWLARQIGSVPLSRLSNAVFLNVLNRIPAAERGAWIARLPAAHAAWARDVLSD